MGLSATFGYFEPLEELKNDDESEIHVIQKSVWTQTMVGIFYECTALTP